MERNRVYEIEPRHFLTLIVVTVLILTVIGAFIDYFVISNLDIHYNTNVLLYDPCLLLTGLIL
ncbi:MAG: hypothetical protein KAW09_01395, partial [Thermoplasmata archaeon]|nr:hypothetical protein [Thermoplasmata archaeon]